MLILDKDNIDITQEIQKVNELYGKKLGENDHRQINLFIRTEVDILRPAYNPNTHPKNPEIFHYNYNASILNRQELNEMKTYKASQFVKKLHNEKEEFEKKRKRLEQQAQERLNEELGRAFTKEKEGEAAKLQNKLMKLQDSIVGHDKRKEVRLQESKKTEEEYFKSIKEKQPFYMYKKLQEDYKIYVEEPELERIKKIKANLRDLYKPMDKNDIVEREKRVAKDWDDMKEKFKNAEAPWLKVDYKRPSFESKFHKIFQDENGKIKRAVDEEKEKRKQLREREINYAKEVKENHLPSINKSKELELKMLIQKLTTKEIKKKRPRSADGEEAEAQSEEDNNPRTIAIKYWEGVRKEYKKKRKEEEAAALANGKVLKSPNNKDKSTDKTGVSGRNFKEFKVLPIEGKTTASIKSENLGYRNYLPEVKKGWKRKSHIDEISSMLRNSSIDEVTKKEYVKSMVYKIELNARRKEQLMRLKQTGNEITEEDPEIDEMYINAIKAKLEMLGDGKSD